MSGERFRIIAANAFDFSTINTSGSTAPDSGSSLSYLQSDRRARVARWSGTVGATKTVTIKGNWAGAGKYISGICLDRFNLTPAALVRFRTFAATDWTGAANIDTGSVAPYAGASLGNFEWAVAPLGASILDGFYGYRFWNAQLTRALAGSYQIDITDTLADAYIELGRVIMGDYFEPAANADYGLKFGWKEKTEQEESDGGSLMSDGRIPRRAVSGAFSDLEEAERLAWSDILRYVGMRKAFLATFVPAYGGQLERDLCIPRAKFSQAPDLSWDYPTGHALPFQIVEA